MPLLPSAAPSSSSLYQACALLVAALPLAGGCAEAGAGCAGRAAAGAGGGAGLGSPMGCTSPSATYHLWDTAQHDITLAAIRRSADDRFQATRAAVAGRLVSSCHRKEQVQMREAHRFAGCALPQHADSMLPEWRAGLDDLAVCDVALPMLSFGRTTGSFSLSCARHAKEHARFTNSWSYAALCLASAEFAN